MNNKTNDPINDEYVDYHGYHVYRNGKVISKKGRELRPYSLTHPNSHVKLFIQGKEIPTSRAVLVYSCFTGEPVNTYKNVMCFKNGNREDVSFDNLYVVTKSVYIKNLHMKGENKFTAKEKAAIQREYKRRQSKGMKDASIRKLALKHGCSYKTMRKTLQKVLEKEGGTVHD